MEKMILTFDKNILRHLVSPKISQKTVTTLSLLTLGTLLVLATSTEKVVAEVSEQVAVASETLEVAYLSTLRDEYHVQALSSETHPIALHIRVAETQDHQQASVLLNNSEVMKFRSPLDGLSPTLRAKRTANRLYAFLSVQGDARLIQPSAQGDEAVIRMGDEVLVRIDQQTAEKSKNKVKHLALIWTNLTRKALGVHPIMRGAMPDSRSKLNRDDYIDPATFKGNGHKLTGIASWYGPGFQGRRAADGSRYDMYEMTAAHKSLPFGTIVHVRNEKNGKTVVVRITDRGPYIDGRIIDLSKAAADVIGMPGITPVTVELMERNPNFKIPEPVIHPPSLKEMAQDMKVMASKEGSKKRLEERLEENPPEVLPETGSEVIVTTDPMATPVQEEGVMTEESINVQAIEEESPEKSAEGNAEENIDGMLTPPEPEMMTPDESSVGFEPLIEKNKEHEKIEESAEAESPVEEQPAKISVDLASD